MDKTELQSSLDLVAEEMERAGFADLGEKIDYYNDRLTTANAAEVALIKRALRGIHTTAKSRLDHVAPEGEKAQKASAVTLKARRSSVARRETLKRRLQTIIAKRKKAADKLTEVKAARKERVKNRKQRIAK